MSEHSRKRIAVLVGHPEEYSHALFLNGFIEEAFGLDYDVVVFAMYIKYQDTLARAVGDSSIFKLINYDRFDCIVVCADTIQTKGLSQQIEEDLHARYKGKVLFVDQDSKYFPSIHIDNYTPEKMVIDHLIEKHGLRDIAFLTGKSWHPHSIIRLEAYKDSLKEHGIKFNEERVFYGDFWYTSGESLADSLIKSGEKLPQAVACANDCMALGFAKIMTANGYSIPDDIVVVGCDSNDEGRHAPIPLTSIPLASEELGANSALMAHALITDTEPQKVPSRAELFVGGTCGCNCDSAKPVYFKRNSWDTELSLATIFSPFNNMDEDLIAQTTFTGLVSAIFSSIHLVRGFDGFDLCLNPRLGEADVPFEDKIMNVIKCGAEYDNNDRILTDTYIDRDDMLPELYEAREKPSVFYFMPLFYDASIFGYSAVRYDGRTAVISQEYRTWLRSICRGIECFRRSDTIIRSSKIARSGITTDSMTGLLNYRGFLEQADTFLNLMNNNGGHMGALAVDIKNLSYINGEFGRKEGDRAIVSVANALESLFSTRNCICFRPGNDELVALRITRKPCDRELLDEKDKLMKLIADNPNSPDYTIELYYGTESGSPTTSEEMERLVNVAISRKNNNKALAFTLSNGSLTEDEQKEAQVVMLILDENRMTYHFQPIVDARTGKIYSYEALMRPDVVPYLPPPVVLRYAKFFDRLYDVEKLTFANVIKVMETHKSILKDGKKVFINSIPGHMLSDNDIKMLEECVSKLPGSIVVELTEQSEISDDELEHMKKTYERIGIETAVDDYGTGYSNVANLLRYTPDYVKIDRALLSGIQDSPQKQHFVRDIIEFSHKNGIKALAEGVETSEELHTVLELGADLLQGYYLAMPGKDMVQTINSLVVDEIRRFSLIKESSGSKN
ncbi:diguanylate cyclase (GGDEF) domain-containing protein [Ruminococcaceae bacterium YRB3002]|nr:diguanylate cyclase (GGDEF) domain-containing protein [Ruminococcaceae bacterium YRB3002]